MTSMPGMTGMTRRVILKYRTATNMTGMLSMTGMLDMTSTPGVTPKVIVD